MLVSYKWLNEFLDLKDIPALELADKMSRTGIEVEEVNSLATGLKKIVVGYVEECLPHPDSDHLSVCQVDVGEEELFQIVCGAPNITAGKKVIVALPNSRIAGNVKIKKGKIRGQVSLGMICSLDELGFNEKVVAKEYSDGIFFLPAEAVPGEEVFKYLDMDDEIIELSITPNRADALSMRGVAYEVGAIYRQTPKLPELALVEDQSRKIENYLSAKVADQQEVPNYRLRVIEDLTIKESPMWLQNRLMSAGIRPISNVVDVTNYVMLLFGQPMHAFDYHQLGSQEMLVRRSNPGEKLVTLDGVERELTAENIVITNGTDPVALAGTMGGLDSEITAQTTTVVLEAATFDGVSIRKTSKQFGLRSESSSRFEKGTNLATVKAACDFGAALIAELGEGKVIAGELVASEFSAEDIHVSVTLSHLNRSLGTDLNLAVVSEIFTTLGFEFTEAAETFTVTIPPRRWDIKIPADLVEEVARIYGYDELPSTLPSGEALPGALTETQQKVRQLRSSLEGAGLSEAVSYALTTEAKATDFVLSKEAVVKLQSPMSEDHSVLRQNLTSGLLDDVAYNVARKNNNLALYETGNIFIAQGEGELPVEKRHLAIALTGLWQEASWQGEKVPVDYFLLKGIVERLFAELGATDLIRYEATTDYAELHPGRTAKVILGETPIGFIGQVHPVTAKAYELNETYVAELDLTELFAAKLSKVNFATVPKFPGMKRDIALLVEASAANQEIVAVINANGGKFLQDVKLFDLYQGANLGADKKSLAYSLTFLNPEATLVDEEVNQAMAKIQTALSKEFGAEIR